MAAMCSSGVDSRLAYRRGAGPAIARGGAEPVDRAAQSVVDGGVRWAGACAGVSPGRLELRGNQVDAVEAVLVAEGLQHDEQRLLAPAVGRFRGLGESIPQVLFGDRTRRELGIRAQGPRLHEL